MNDESDPSSSPSSELVDGSSTTPSRTTEKTCEQCGDAIATGDWYPISTERSADGSLRLYPFCSEECQSDWLEAPGE